MKKKLFTLLTLALLSIGNAWAGDVYKISFNGSNAESKNGTEVTAGTYFSWNSSKHNFNQKFNDCTYDGVAYKQGLKMEGATSVSWTSTAEATVTIVQSTWSANTIKFDGSELAVADASTDISGCRVYTITNVAAGSHSVTRGSGESGIFAIIVEYTGTVMTQLTAPEITVNSASGEVSIGAVANASKVTYTTDGSDPTAESTEYTAAFQIEDGTTVKAIAIGDGVSYTNSSVTTKVAYIDGITVAEPSINQYNGTVALTCATPGALIEYSIDNVTFTTYTRAFTLSEDATVYARATRENCTTSNVASAEVTTIGNGAATKTIWMGHGSFDNNTTNSMTGMSGDDAEGIVMTITGNSDKKWSSGNAKIKIGNIERTAIKLSNGAQNTITLPTGMKATRITFYSFINGATSNTKSYWKEFKGEAINGADVPMGAWNDVTDHLTNPDARSFALNGDETTITFNNAGEQLCFIIALEVIEDPVTITPAYAMTTYVTTKALDFTNVDGLTAYVATGATNSAVQVAAVTAPVPAGTPLMLVGTPGTEYTVPVAASATAPANLLQAGDGTTVFDGESYDYILASDGKFYQIKGGTTVAVGKAYLHLDSAPGVRSLVVKLDNEATGIESVDSEAADAEAIYNVSGQRVAKAVKGLYIVNGKKVIIK